MAELESIRTQNQSDLEKGHTEALRETLTSGSVTISAELFEKLYLSPQNKTKGELRQTFGNPTPMALIGFLLCLTPLSCDLMGWRGAGGLGAASIPVYFFMGGVLMFLSGILEWVLGNSFPSIVFCTFGTFWLSLGGTLNPSFGAYAFYAPADATSPAAGLATTGFNASLGFWLLSMGLLAIVFAICALRTNVIFVIMFLSIIPALALLTAAFWLQADDFVGTAQTVHKLFVGAGAIFFVTSAAGWYMLLSIMLAIMEFPFQLPVGDLSTVIKARGAT
ncbi:GPR1/FUN34/yaaH family-domain-containing protein [Ilyonectria destructans]|nr:GPR1/FUN34/yaaH family-domain-containing protein [Ilyonectria destructans]